MLAVRSFLTTGNQSKVDHNQLKIDQNQSKMDFLRLEIASNLVQNPPLKRWARQKAILVRIQHAKVERGRFLVRLARRWRFSVGKIVGLWCKNGAFSERTVRLFGSLRFDLGSCVRRFRLDLREYSIICFSMKSTILRMKSISF